MIVRNVLLWQFRLSVNFVQTESLLHSNGWLSSSCLFCCVFRTGILRFAKSV